MLYIAEARVLTRKAQFSKSGFATLADSTIREACENGENTATILVPLNVVEDMVNFLCEHGFEEVAIAGTLSGAMVSVAW